MSTNAGSSSSISQLGQNAFLQLLAVQMKNQDPLQPVDNTQFVAQLAQFSSLQELTTISSQLGSLSTATMQVQTADQLLSAFNLIGTNVTLQDSSGNLVTGTVSGVNISGGQANVDVAGNNYPLSSITSVTGK